MSTFLLETDMNRLSLADRAQILALLVEGNSMRAVTRITGKSINTVTKLLVDVGTACSRFQHDNLKNLPCKRVQCDEIWAFCGMKEKNVPPEHKGTLGYGDVYTWTAICADTKLVPSFLVGQRNAACAYMFMQDLAWRMASRIQLTTDGYKVYVDAVDEVFVGNVDYAMLVKMYGGPLEPHDVHRYSVGEVTGVVRENIVGSPDEFHVSTSFVERQNLTMRMSMRRFTRLSNGFSKKIENLQHAVALHFMHYNFARIHKTLRVTPAMEASVSDRVWSLEEIAGLAN